MTQAILQGAGAAYAIACSAIGARIYALRVENPATVADVFD
jgi:hypothetical protein